MPLSCSSLKLCVMETRARIDPQPHVNYTPERFQPCALLRYVCVPLSVCCVCMSGQSHQSKHRKMDKQWQSKHCGGQDGKEEKRRMESGGGRRGHGGNQGNGE